MTLEISQQAKIEFANECTILKPLATEICLNINLDSIVLYYKKRIGIHPLLESWEELRLLLSWVLVTARTKAPGGLPLHVRFTGGGMCVWLVMRIYALCVFEADALFYAGDCLIKI